MIQRVIRDFIFQSWQVAFNDCKGIIPVPEKCFSRLISEVTVASSDDDSSFRFAPFFLIFAAQLGGSLS